MSIIDEIKKMSPEERKELHKVLTDLEPKPENEIRSLGNNLRGPAACDDYGNPLTKEQIYDKEHPLILVQYGRRESYHVFGQEPKVKFWTDAEVDAYNAAKKEEWLAEKRKYFPDATLPE